MSTADETADAAASADQRRLRSELWRACAGGGRFNVPAVSSRVFYFPEGHMEHASDNVDLRNHPRIPPYVLCTVSAVDFAADPEFDDPFLRITLDPVAGDSGSAISVDPPGAQAGDPPLMFTKKITQTESSGNRFLVPKSCVKTIFSKLDMSGKLNVDVSDIHGQISTITHDYRGSNHFLTNGWKYFFDRKKLLMGDDVIFVRTADGDGVGIGILRRTWRERVLTAVAGTGRLKAKDVVEAASLAAEGNRFEVVCYPWDGGAQFCVEASRVRESMAVGWTPGMTVTTELERNDVSNLVKEMIEYVGVVAPVQWRGSPWRLLQVRGYWLDRREDVRRVSPWIVDRSHVPSPKKLKRNAILFRRLTKDASSSHSPGLNKPFGTMVGSNREGSGSGSSLDPGVRFQTDPASETTLCEVSMGSEVTSQRLDVASIGSYVDLFNRLASLFGIEGARVVYRVDAGELRLVGEEPWSDFARTVKRLWITDSYGTDGFPGVRSSE